MKKPERVAGSITEDSDIVPRYCEEDSPDFQRFLSDVRPLTDQDVTPRQAIGLSCAPLFNGVNAAPT